MNAAPSILEGASAARALTVDVFDTAITRRWALPAHVFAACAGALRAAGLITLDDDAWMTLRIACERRAGAKWGADLARMDDIYAELAAALGWSAAAADRARSIELEVERAGMVAVPAIRDLWETAVRQQRRRRFLSDMYLDEGQVADLIGHCGFTLTSGDVWVSAQRGATKRSGGLFALALAAWQDLRPDEVLHVGDHPVSDAQQARAAGLRNALVQEAKLPGSARAVLAELAAPLPLRSLVAGAMRLARLRVAPAVGAPRTAAGLQLLGTCHAGPLLTMYVWWLLMDAGQRGLSRLYFLARDGQVLLAIARRLQAAGCAPGVDLRYLHASRQAWFAPSLRRWDVEELEALLDEPDRLADPSKLARRLGFANAAAMSARWPALAVQLAPTLGNAELARRLVELVPADDALAHADALRSRALAYLEQQGLRDGSSWAIVDLGWRGRLQQALARILQTAAADAVTRGYYLKLLEQPADRPAGWEAYSLCEDGVLPGPAHLLEMLCEADHGSTRGYLVDEPTAVRPDFDPQPDAAIVDWGLHQYREAVLAYATALAEALPLLPSGAPTRTELHALALAIGRETFGRPPVDVARALATMPCSHSVNHDAHAPLAEAMPPMQAWLQAMTLGRWRPAAHPNRWLPGSLALAGDARAYRLYAGLHRRADAWRRRWRWRRPRWVVDRFG